jgi:hypothetical protein
MWFVSLSNVFVENDLFLIFLDVHVRLDCSFKCSMWHPEKCVTNSSYLLTFMKICNPFLLVYFTCTFFFSFPVLPFSLSFSHRKIAQISLSLVPWKFRFQCEFSTSDLRIDLILASSVAIMPNFLHSSLWLKVATLSYLYALTWTVPSKSQISSKKLHQSEFENWNWF